MGDKSIRNLWLSHKWIFEKGNERIGERWHKIDFILDILVLWHG